jgi:hypothetical protein
VTSDLLPISHKSDQLLNLKHEGKFANEYCWLRLRQVPSADDAFFVANSHPRREGACMRLCDRA